MSKKRVFNNVETAYLLENRTLPPAVLAKELDAPLELVVAFLGDIKSNSQFDRVVGKAKDKLGKTRAVVMTESAAHVGDETKTKKTIADPTYIHRPKGK